MLGIGGGVEMTKYLSAGLLAGSVFLSQAVAAFAGCTQANLQGNWRFQLHTGGFYTLCTLTVGADGNISSNKKCTIWDSSSSKATVAAGSHLTLATPATCTFAGVLKLGTGDTLDVTLTDATLSSSHQTAFGVGMLSSTEFAFTLTKY